jgi:hypothetical protein
MYCGALYNKSRDSSVAIALGYGLDDRGSRVRFPIIILQCHKVHNKFEIGRLVQKLNGGHNLHFKDGKRLNGQKEQKKRGGILKKK